ELASIAKRTHGSASGGCVVTMSRGVAAARSRLTFAVTIGVPSPKETRRKHAGSSASPGVGFNGITTRNGAPGSERTTGSPSSSACADEAIAAAISNTAAVASNRRYGAYRDTAALSILSAVPFRQSDSGDQKQAPCRAGRASNPQATWEIVPGPAP